MLRDFSQQNIKNNSGPNVERFMSGPYLKENKKLGLDLTNNMETNLFSIGPPSTQLKGNRVSPRARTSQAKKTKQVRRP